VVTNDPALGERLRELRVYGWRNRYISELPGMNTRLDELQAAILRVQLPHLDAENARRAEIARMYDHSLAEIPGLLLPSRTAGMRHVYHQYVIRLQNRDELREHLRARQIETAVLYPLPIHLQPAYRGRIVTAGTLSITERAAAELLCLPSHPWLDDSDVERVCEAIAQWFHG
jgi:dTDP-4-amino-4,6-dideoxygalactose transaminase